MLCSCFQIKDPLLPEIEEKKEDDEEETDDEEGTICIYSIVWQCLPTMYLILLKWFFDFWAIKILITIHLPH